MQLNRWSLRIACRFVGQSQPRWRWHTGCLCSAAYGPIWWQIETETNSSYIYSNDSDVLQNVAGLHWTRENLFWIVNTLRPSQNGPHFPDDSFKYIFLNENVWIMIDISLKLVPQGPINKFTGTGELPAQMASYAENVSVWWRHYVDICRHSCN